MNKLNKLLSGIHSDHILIQTHKFPDSDALGCAYAMQELLEHFGIKSDIIYGGFIDNVSLQMMVDYLKVNLRIIDSVKKETVKETVLSVDSQASNENTAVISETVNLSIDHHEGFNNDIMTFEDIRPDYGACSSIVAEYFFDNNIQISDKAATALLFGQQIDTDNLTRGTIAEDVNAFAKLYPLCDKDFLKLLHRSQIDSEGLKAFAYAFNNLEIDDGICFIDVGSHCPEVLVAQICDFSLDVKEVQLSVVYSKRKNGIKFSMRSYTPQYDAGVLMYAMTNNYGNGGGHAHMAGGFVPYREDMSDDELVDRLRKKLMLVVNMICEKSE